MSNGNNNAPIFRHCVLDIFRKLLLLAFALVVWTMAVFPYNYFGILFAAIALIKLPLTLWHLHVAMSYRRQQRYWTYLAHDHTQGRITSLATPDDPVIAKLTGAQGAFLGAYMGALLFYNFFARGNGHGVCIAPPRTGKTTCNVMTTLMNDYSSSIIVNDLKGENHDVTADIRAAHGQRIIKIAPFEEKPKHKFNPIYILADDVAFNQGYDVHELAMKVAQVLVPDTERSGNDKVFIDGAKRILVALLLHMAAIGKPEDCHLPRLRQLVWADHAQLKLIAVQLQESDGLRGLLKEYGNQLNNLLKPELTKMFSSFMVDCLEGVSIFDPASPWTENIKASTFTYDDLLDEKTTTYKCMSQHKLITHGKYNTLIDTLLIEMVARRKNPVRLLMLLDEAGNMPRIPASTLKTALSLLPAKGLRIYSFWQSFNQMKDLYGEEISNLILDQASMIQAWSIRDLTQQEIWSKRAGMTTVKRSSINQDPKEMDYSRSLRTEEKEEKVLTGTEISKMSDDEQLIYISGHPIIHATRVPFWQVEEFRAWAAPNPCEPAGYPADQPVKYSLRKHAKCA